jgi:GTP 3',8-cyclase
VRGRRSDLGDGSQGVTNDKGEDRRPGFRRMPIDDSMDKYRIDTHKLLYHVDRVNEWLRGRPIYPIYMEISPSGACNHRCTYCGLDFMEYRRRFLDAAVLHERLTEMGRLGVRSIMYAGEGEPLLHPQLAEILQRTSASGIDAALTTNGVRLTSQVAEAILPVAKWIKVSINGGTAKTYAGIHRCPEADFDRVIANLKDAARIRGNRGYACTLGMQQVLLPENCHEATTLAAIARDIGMDYLVIKPYSQHPRSKTTRYSEVRYGEYESLAAELEGYNTPDFQVIFRHNAMSKWDNGQRDYSCCQALPFWSYIDAGGNVWGCSMFLGDERFRYGNIQEQSFEAIWRGDKRTASLAWVEQNLEVAQCRVNCRMDEVNRYLWELKHPPVHANFI